MRAMLSIPGRLPGLNDYISAERSNRYKAAAMKRQEQEKVLWLAHSQLHGITFKKPVKIKYLWYEQNKKRDLDNIAGFGHKVIQDGLVQAGVLENDSLKCVAGFSDDFFVDKDNPRIVVVITDEED